MEKYRPIVWLAYEKKSSIGDPLGDVYDIIVPIGFSEELPYGKIVTMITEEEASGYELLGVGYGINFAQAVTLGEQHCLNFFVRSVGYRYLIDSPHARMMSRATGEYYIAVQFYELKDRFA